MCRARLALKKVLVTRLLAKWSALEPARVLEVREEMMVVRREEEAAPGGGRKLMKRKSSAEKVPKAKKEGAAPAKRKSDAKKPTKRAGGIASMADAEESLPLLQVPVERRRQLLVQLVQERQTTTGARRRRSVRLTNGALVDGAALDKVESMMIEGGSGPQGVGRSSFGSVAIGASNRTGCSSGRASYEQPQAEERSLDEVLGAGTDAAEGT